MTVDEYREKCTMLWDEYSNLPSVSSSLDKFVLLPSDFTIQIQFEKDARRLKKLADYLQQCILVEKSKR